MYIFGELTQECDTSRAASAFASMLRSVYRRCSTAGGSHRRGARILFAVVGTTNQITVHHCDDAGQQHKENYSLHPEK
jgi:hypothetical protein